MFKSIHKHWAHWLMSLVLAASALLLQTAGAEEEDKARTSRSLTPEQADALVQQVLQAPPAEKGADTCLKCHDEDNEYPVLPLFKTRHAVSADPRAPFAGDQCESCHGPGGHHMEEVKGDEQKAPILGFGRNTWTPARVQNERCLACHTNHERIEWTGSSHEFNQVACASCHKVHVERDHVMADREQAEVCYSCHANLKAKFYQASHHPVREGQMACSDCHNVHGEDGAGLLVKTTSREKCTSCHAELRGPFLWEHQPAAEDCTICHVTHGSNLPALLKKRPPFLCQECHAQAGHPSVSYDGSPLSSVYLGVKGCLNCHSQVHGSNHPSGVSALR